MQPTLKQQKARERNWRIRMLKGIIANTKYMTDTRAAIVIQLVYADLEELATDTSKDQQEF